jgi:hypothetical protein
MALTKNKNFGASIGGQSTSKDKSQLKRVVDIILSSDHPAYQGPNSIGTIFFVDEKSQEKTTKPYSLPQAKPINRNNFIYPLRGELVLITQAVSNNYYNELGGNPNFVSNYYSPALNIYNNSHNNSLPTIGKKPIKQNYNIVNNNSDFNIQEKFTGRDLPKVKRQLDNYLINLGYEFGINDINSPKYNLTQQSNGIYTYELDESFNDKIKLGNYFKENPRQKSLTPSEGDYILEGRNGQRVRFGHTGPNGSNIFSIDSTEIEDGKPTIGEPLIAISIGENSFENSFKDKGSIYILSNQSCLIIPASNNIDSLNATYTEVSNPLDEIQKSPQAILPEAPSNVNQDINFETTEQTTIIEVPNIASTITEESLPPEDTDFNELDDIAIEQYTL